MELEAFHLRVSDTVKHLQLGPPTGRQPHHQPEELLQVGVHLALGQPIIPVGTDKGSCLGILEGAATRSLLMALLTGMQSQQKSWGWEDPKDLHGLSTKRQAECPG